MTRRSILAGKNQTIIIKAGGSVTIKGQPDERLVAETKDRGGLSVERHSESEIGRARAAIGEHVLFDVRIKVPTLKEKPPGEVIEVQMGDSGEVLVPFEANLKVYAGKNIQAQGIGGQVDAYAGLHLTLRDVRLLGNASAGGRMDLDCQSMLGTYVEFKAGGDLRFYIHDLTSARIRVKDIGGYWEAHIGDGERTILLKSGGDVTFVTDEPVAALPPHYILGNIEKPDQA